MHCTRVFLHHVTLKVELLLTCSVYTSASWSGAVNHPNLQAEMQRRLESLLAWIKSSQQSLPPAGQALANLRSAIAARKTPFFVSGSANFKQGAWMAGLSPASGRLAALHFDSTSLSNEIDTFCSVAEPAAFGLGMATVHDPTYRSALAIAPHRVAFSGWEMSDDGQGMLRDAHRFLAPLSCGIRAALSKVGTFRAIRQTCMCISRHACAAPKLPR